MKRIINGFTLIELLAVILILGIIALIAIPTIGNIVNAARKEAFVDSVQGAFRAASYQIGMDNMSGSIKNEYQVNELSLSNNTLSGKFTFDENNNLIANLIKNEKYCAYGISNDLKIENNCILLDVTKPVIDDNKIILISTTNSIEVILDKDIAIDPESNIIKTTLNLYKDNQKLESKDITDTYILKNLTSDTLYTIELVVINGNNLENIYKKNIKTKLIDNPTYQVEPTDWATSKKITIDYPNGFINEYSIDLGSTWIKYIEPINITKNCSIIARVSDGYNIITGTTLNITKIDTEAPTISISPNGKNNLILIGKTSISTSTIAGYADQDSGIKEALYAFSESSTVEPTNYTAISYSGSSLYTNMTGPTQYLWIKVTDKAGNTNKLKSEPFTTSYQIKYNLNGGTGTINDQTKEYNKSLTITSSIPTKSGYTFKGWSTSSTGIVTYASNSTYSDNKAINLYAVWQANLVEATETLSFPSTTTQNRTLTKTLTGFNNIVSVTVNNGNVSYTMNGNTISASVSGGTGTLKQTCENRYSCEEYFACHTSCWSCSESSTGTCCGCPGCWPGGECCCSLETTCGYKDVCSSYYYYEYTVTIKYMKGV